MMTRETHDDRRQTLSVNGTIIPTASVLAEMQHHPATSADQAFDQAARALALKELLLQRAADMAVADDLDDEARIAAVIDQEVTTTIPEPDEASCRRWYEANRARFRSPDLFEASHILFPAPPDDPAARAAAKARAEDALAVLAERPEAFADLARELSACPSGKLGGSLGQVRKGETAPELESFFLALEPGQIAPVPVPSRYGYHVVQLHARIDGQQLPFEAVRDHVAEYLRDAAFARATHQYLTLLAGAAEVTGVDLGGSTSPLVQ